MASRSSRKMAQMLTDQKKLAARRNAAQVRYPPAFTQLTNQSAADAAKPSKKKHHKRHYS